MVRVTRHVLYGDDSEDAFTEGQKPCESVAPETGIFQPNFHGNAQFIKDAKYWLVGLTRLPSTVTRSRRFHKFRKGLHLPAKKR